MIDLFNRLRDSAQWHYEELARPIYSACVVGQKKSLHGDEQEHFPSLEVVE